MKNLFNLLFMVRLIFIVTILSVNSIALAQTEKKISQTDDSLRSTLMKIKENPGNLIKFTTKKSEVSDYLYHPNANATDLTLFGMQGYLKVDTVTTDPFLYGTKQNETWVICTLDFSFQSYDIKQPTAENIYSQLLKGLKDIFGSTLGYQEKTENAQGVISKECTFSDEIIEKQPDLDDPNAGNKKMSAENPLGPRQEIFMYCNTGDGYATSVSITFTFRKKK